MGDGKSRMHSRVKKVAAVFMAVCMAGTGQMATVNAASAPEHHKYIRYNGDESYTLTLDVTGMYDSETVKQKMDVLLIVDKSGSMDEKYGSGWNAPRRLEKLKEVVTGTEGLTSAILESDEMNARMAVVTYSGDYENDAPYNDASSIISGDWTSDKDTVDTRVNQINANGGTNCQAGLLEGMSVLGSARTDAKKVVIFLSDGQPTFQYDKNGYTIGQGNADPRGENAAAAYSQAEKITGLSGFYTIGISSDSSSVFLNTLKDKPQAEEKAYYPAANAKDLVDVFNSIIADITEYTCRDVTIMDTLSDYVEIDGEFDPVFKVIDQSGNEITSIKVGDEEIAAGDLIHAAYDSASKKMTAEFAEGYVLNQNYTYSLSFKVKPSQLAYDTYADAGYDAVGSEGSDAPGNDTSSGKAGFYSNAQGDNAPELIYTFGKSDSASSSSAAYVEKPVIQVDALNIPVEKKWENVSDEDNLPEKITVNLYQDGKSSVYRTITLTESEGWKGCFESVAKGHSYTVREEEIAGFESAVTGNQTNGFVVTNTRLPNLTINKEVTGKMGDKTKAFQILISLKDREGNPVNGTYSYIGEMKAGVSSSNPNPGNGTLTFVDGKASIELKHGHQITLKQLPAGSTFTIEESLEVEVGYSVSYNGNWSENVAGTLDQDTLVEIVNQKDQVPVTGIGENQTGEPALWAGIGFAAVEAIFAIWFYRRRIC